MTNHFPGSKVTLCHMTQTAVTVVELESMLRTGTQKARL